MEGKRIPPLSLLVSFGETARWRAEMAEQFPNDSRNAEAANTLRLFEKEAEQLEGSPLHQRLAQLFDAVGEARGYSPSIESELSDDLKAIGC